MNDEAANPDAVSVHQNQTLSTITDGKVDSKLRPDVATVKTDGTVDVVEIPSPKTQTRASQQVKVDNMQKLLGDKAGSNSRVEDIRPNAPPPKPQ